MQWWNVPSSCDAATTMTHALLRPVANSAAKQRTNRGQNAHVRCGRSRYGKQKVAEPMAPVSAREEGPMPQLVVASKLPIALSSNRESIATQVFVDEGHRHNVGRWYCMQHALRATNLIGPAVQQIACSVSPRAHADRSTVNRSSGHHIAVCSRGPPGQERGKHRHKHQKHTCFM